MNDGRTMQNETNDADKFLWNDNKLRIKYSMGYKQL